MTGEQKVAVLFPGQGSQKLGMLQDFYQEFATFRGYLAQASDILGYDLWQLIQNDGDKLGETRYTQPILLTCSVAMWEVAKELGAPQPMGVAGHSLGEYSALVVSGVLDFASAVRLVALRGQWMEEETGSATTGMLVVVGLDESQVRQLRGSDDPTRDDYLVISNYNSPKQFVLSGYAEICRQTSEKAKQMGAKIAKLLPVSVASHCALMQRAADRLAAEFEKISFKTPEIPVYRNVDGGIHQDPLRIPMDLKLQMVSGVQWVPLVKNVLRDGATCLCECGPGHVLTGLNRRIVDAVAANTEGDGQPEILVASLETVAQMREWLDQVR